MVEEDRYCIDILTQIAAVNTALDSLALKILDEHVRHRVAGALQSGDAADAAVRPRSTEAVNVSRASARDDRWSIQQRNR
jgi:DNA-binding FrmR family transcriptional regulator